MASPPVPSPCISVCRMDERTGWCEGCLRTLAEIARMLSVHESTISRKLDKLAKSLRKQILAGLGRRGMSRRPAEEALEVDVRDLTLNLRDRLAQVSPDETFHKKNVGAPAGDGSG